MFYARASTSYMISGLVFLIVYLMTFLLRVGAFGFLPDWFTPALATEINKTLWFFLFLGSVFLAVGLHRRVLQNEKDNAERRWIYPILGLGFGLLTFGLLVLVAAVIIYFVGYSHVAINTLMTIVALILVAMIVSGIFFITYGIKLKRRKLAEVESFKKGAS